MKRYTTVGFWLLIAMGMIFIPLNDQILGIRSDYFWILYGATLAVFRFYILSYVFNFQYIFQHLEKDGANFVPAGAWFLSGYKNDHPELEDVSGICIVRFKGLVALLIFTLLFFGCMVMCFLIDKQETSLSLVYFFVAVLSLAIFYATLRLKTKRMEPNR